MAVLVAFTTPALTQEKSADTMELLRQKMKADKKLVVGANLELTESEAQRFWPVYEDYQRDLQKLNQRTIALIERYAADYRNKSPSTRRPSRSLMRRCPSSRPRPS